MAENGANPGRRQIIVRLLGRYRWQFAGLLVLTVGLSVLAMLPPLLIRAVINRVITDGEWQLLPLLAAFMLGVPLLHAACSFLHTLGVMFVGQQFVMALRRITYTHLLHLPLRYHARHSVGESVNRLMGDTGVVQNVLTSGSIQLVFNFLSSVFAISVTFALNWRLATLLVAVVAVFVVNYKFTIARIRRATRGYLRAEDRVAGGVQNRLIANLTVKAYGMEDREQDVFSDQSGTSLDLVKESRYAVTTFMMNMALLRDIGRVTVYVLGCALVLQEQASYGDVIAFTTYAMQMLVPAVNLTGIAQELQDVRISLDRLFELLDRQPEVTSRPGATRMKRARGRLDFDRVRFHYEEAQPVLRGFDLHVEPGETVALIGPTGCGKTTIVSLLLRFFDVEGGAVRVDGVDVRDLELDSLRRQFGIVLQEPLLFNVSIADNIRYARRDASAEDIRRVAKAAEIHDFIESLPRGYESMVGSREVQLSVGEKQRLSIARALVADPAIIIMDEATSSLDSESERAIQAAMAKFLAGRTSVIVAHRLSTIRNADRIVLIDEGTIRETGRHGELMAVPGGRYRDLYDAHAGKGVIGDQDWEGRPEAER